MNKYDIVLEKLSSCLKELLDEKDEILKIIKENDGNIQKLSDESKAIEGKNSYYRSKINDFGVCEDFLKDLRKKFRKECKIGVLVVALVVAVLVVINSLVGYAVQGYFTEMIKAFNCSLLLSGGVVGLVTVSLLFSSYLTKRKTLNKQHEEIADKKRSWEEEIERNLELLNTLREKIQNIDTENNALRNQLDTIWAKISEAENSIYLVQDERTAAIDKLIQDNEKSLNSSYDESGLSFPLLERNKD